METKVLVKELGQALEGWDRGEESQIETAGGRMPVRWDEKGSATGLGQLGFFAEYLEETGLFERWVKACPLAYGSPNAPDVVDVLGTWLLSILEGQKRYAHVTGWRGDEVALRLLGMKKIISDESLRRALARLAPCAGKRESEEDRRRREAQLLKSTVWMDRSLLESIGKALDTPWILDGDTTVKPLYGHQDGAEVSYNPKKPGRPSHVLHTDWIGNLRRVRDAEVQKGKAHAPQYGLPRLREILERLLPEQRPARVRGDSVFGNEGVMATLEEKEQTDLFKLRQSAGVKRLIERQGSRHDWQPTGQGGDAVEATLRLSGGSQARRVIVLRRRVERHLLAKGQGNGERPGQAHLLFADTPEQLPVWAYSVRVTNTEYALEAIGQLYRDRADCENGFDELKNPWGWGGYTPQDLERCNLSARAVALIYNGWSGYVRLAHPKARLEAITRRPLLLAGVARLTQHAGQCRLLVTLTHAANDRIKTMITNAHKGLRFVSASAPPLPKAERWIALVRYITEQFLANRPRNPFFPALLSQPIMADSG
jgi:hypothetical protein